MKISKVGLPPFSNDLEIKKIDVSQGEDFWILTDKEELYHWSTILKNHMFMQKDVFDFSIGSDGTAVYLNNNDEIYIRNMFFNSWFRIDDGNYKHKTISICDSNTIFTTNDHSDFIIGVYNVTDNTYNWEYVDELHYYYDVYCAPRDQSLWLKDHYSFVYRYINRHQRTPLTEISFRHIKVLSEHHAIGLDYINNLWEYTIGTWVLIRRNVKSATINYNGIPPSFPFPFSVHGIKKIDVGRGEDFWILTNDDSLYHWDKIKQEFVFKVRNILDFSVGLEGMVVYVSGNGVYRNSYSSDSWNQISDGRSSRSITICDYNTIFATDNCNHLAKAIYDIKTNTYDWEFVGTSSIYYQVSCSSHDHSLWYIDKNNLVYLFVNHFVRVLKSEVQFKQIKSLSTLHAIGIDFNDSLWLYTNGTWTWIRDNVNNATINFN
ncbi:15175_t:CDS:10, partial [Funneliformis mosseae]